MRTDPLIKVGFVMRTHGLKGQLIARFNEECPDLSQLKYLIVELPGGVQQHHLIKSTNYQGDKTYVQLEGVTTLAAAEQLQKCDLLLPKSEMPALAKGEFYDYEVAGFTVIDSAAGELGKLTEIVRAGSGRLLSVSYQGRDLLIPVNDQFVTGIHRKKKHLVVSLPDGYLEIL